MRTPLLIALFSFVHLYGRYENILVPIEKRSVAEFKKFNLALNANEHWYIRSYLNDWIGELKTIKSKPSEVWERDTLLCILSQEVMVYKDSQWHIAPQLLMRKLIKIQDRRTYNTQEKSLLNWCFISHHNPIQKNIWYLFPGVNFGEAIERSIVGIDTNWHLYTDSFARRPILQSERSDSVLFSHLKYRFGLEQYYPGNLIQSYSAGRIQQLLAPVPLKGDLDPRLIILYQMLNRAKKEEWVLMPVLYSRGT